MLYVNPSLPVMGKWDDFLDERLDPGEIAGREYRELNELFKLNGTSISTPALPQAAPYKSAQLGTALHGSGEEERILFQFETGTFIHYSVPETGTSFGLSSREEIGFVITQEYIKSEHEENFGDTEIRRLTFPPYNEEDLIDWDVVVDMENPPYRSREIIQAKLVDKGRVKPLSIEDF